MAAGKSTIAQALAEHFPRSVHMRGDTFRRFIVNGQASMNDIELSDEAVDQLKLRQNIAASAAQLYADAGFTVVLQDIYIDTDLAEMVSRFSGYELYVIVLCPSVETIATRDFDRQQSRQKFAYMEGGLTPSSMDAVLRKNTPKIGLWLDTSELTVSQTVEQILERSDEARI